MEVTASTRPDLNKAQTNTFFMSFNQMEVAKETLDIWKWVAENLKCLGGRMKNPDRDANHSYAMVPQTLYLFGTNIQKRLIKASKLEKYYNMAGCHVTVSNTVYEAGIKSFIGQWAGLKDWKRQMQPV
eukprot:14874772-Ditylum_brightwellii.AAC.1